MGFGKRGKTSFTVHRSEEVIPGDVRLSKQGSSASSEGDLSTDGDRFVPQSSNTSCSHYFQPSYPIPKSKAHIDYIERYTECCVLFGVSITNYFKVVYVLHRRLYVSFSC